jgi:hypothetical protein
LKRKFNSSYIFDVKTYYKNPKFLIINYNIFDDYNLVITEPITLLPGLRKKISAKKANQVILKLYNKQLKSVKKLYNAFITNYLNNNHISNVDNIGINHIQKLHTS